MVKRRTYQVQGMHCDSCEVLVERAFRKLPDVAKVKANQAGWVKVWSEHEPDLALVNQQISQHGYSVSAGLAVSKFSFKRLGGVVLMAAAVYFLFRGLNLAPSLEAGEDLSLGVVFIMGLAAAVSSCIAVTGGLLVAISSAQVQAHPGASGWQKFRPHIFFNIGRVVSYTVLGGAVGALGSVLALSSIVSGLVTLVASLAMIVLGLRLLNIFPWFSRLTIRLPKFIAHRLYDFTGNTRPGASLLMGAGTFFLPCGFTQALQLYVLTRADAGVGAVTMLVFSLGTAPALISLGALTSFVKGRGQRLLSAVAGSAVVALGIINFGYGANLTGLSVKLLQVRESLKITARQQGVPLQNDSNAALVNGQQVVKMDVVARGYSPNRFIVRAGLPVRREINGVNTYGCQSVVQMPSFNITQFVKPGLNVVEFTPRQPGQYDFHCAMGMYTGSFTVLPDNNSLPPAATSQSGVRNKVCDPAKSSCV